MPQLSQGMLLLAGGAALTAVSFLAGIVSILCLRRKRKAIEEAVFSEYN